MRRRIKRMLPASRGMAQITYLPSEVEIYRYVSTQHLEMGQSRSLTCNESAPQVFRPESPTSVAPTNQKWVMLIDLAKCDGGEDCRKACDVIFFVPTRRKCLSVTDSREYNHLHRKGLIEKRIFYRQRLCAGKLPACAE